MLDAGPAVLHTRFPPTSYTLQFASDAPTLVVVADASSVTGEHTVWFCTGDVMFTLTTPAGGGCGGGFVGGGSVGGGGSVVGGGGGGGAFGSVTVSATWFELPPVYAL